MNKIQRFPKTIGTAVNVKDPTNGDSTDATQLDTALKNIADGMLTDAEKTYLESVLGNQKKSAAQALFSVVGSTSGTTSYWSDTTADADKSATRNVVIKFNGVNVTPTTLADLTKYTNSGTGSYTKAITTASSAPATGTVKYKVPAGTYGSLVIGASDDIEVTGSASGDAISTRNAAYYGFSSYNDASQIGNVIANLTRIETNVGAVSGSTKTYSKVTNNGGTGAYLWLVTKGTYAEGQNLGESIMNNAVTDKNFTSPKNSSITMSGYKIVISEKKVGAGDSVNVLLTL